VNASTENASSTTTTATIEEGSGEHHAPVPAAAGGGVHLPPTSLWPITLAFAVTISASSLVLNMFMLIPGLVLFVLALRGWAQELLHDAH
jgi:Cytochrome c oxidase subunit IV